MSTALTNRNMERREKLEPHRGNQEKTLDVASLPKESASELVQLFKLLSDETRLQILYYLVQQTELNVGELCGLLKQSQPAVSHHLALLRVNGLIEMRRDGKHNYYHLMPAKFEGLLDLMFSFAPNNARKVRFERRVLTYTSDSETA